MIGTIEVVYNYTKPCVYEKNTLISIITECDVNSPGKDISINFPDSGIDLGDFNGPVACSHGDTTTHSSMAGSTQDRERGNNSRDGDGDGIPDSSDKCLHTSNPRCFKEAS